MIKEVLIYDTCFGVESRLWTQNLHVNYTFETVGTCKIAGSIQLHLRLLMTCCGLQNQLELKLEFGRLTYEAVWQFDESMRSLGFSIEFLVPWASQAFEMVYP